MSIAVFVSSMLEDASNQSFVWTQPGAHANKSVPSRPLCWKYL
jgi:hypothetical protein